MIRNYRVNSFGKGLVTSIEAKSIPDGAAADVLNWLHLGDKIELRRGMARLGSDAGVGRVSGLITGQTAGADERLFRTRGRKIEYYDETLATPDWTELGTNSLPAAADGEDISMARYHSLAGASVILSSPSSSMYQIKTANPTNLIDFAATTFRGKIKAAQMSVYLWDRKDSSGGKDKTGIYRSKLDKDEVSDYTAVTSESLGAGGSATYTGTLAFKAGGSKRSCFGIYITDGTETFTDDYDGVLTGSLGGTGTINYATGAYSVTFATVAAGSVTANYYWEDPTSGGFADFSKSGTRVAGEGFVIRQDDGGGATQNLAIYNEIFYCLHRFKTWQLSISADDLEASNTVFRERAGIPYFRAYVETGDGIYYVDDTGDKGAVIRLLTIDRSSGQVIPLVISRGIDLSPYSFDYSAGYEWSASAKQDYIIFSCRLLDSPQNDRALLYNKLWKSWDVTDIYASTWAGLDGALIAGDSVTANVYETFSGFDDLGVEIANFWTSGQHNLGIDGVKKFKRFKVEGDIGPDQTIKLYMSYDNGEFVEVGTISGDGSYVDSGTSVNVGTYTLGKKTVGSGSDGVEAFPYVVDISVLSDEFQYVQVKFEATAVGYASVTAYEFTDIRYKGRKVPLKYRSLALAFLGGMWASAFPVHAFDIQRTNQKCYTI